MSTAEVDKELGSDTEKQSERENESLDKIKLSYYGPCGKSVGITSIMKVDYEGKKENASVLPKTQGGIRVSYYGPSLNAKADALSKSAYDDELQALIEEMLKDFEDFISQGKKVAEEYLVHFAKAKIAPLMEQCLPLDEKSRFDSEAFEIFEVLSGVSTSTSTLIDNSTSYTDLMKNNEFQKIGKIYSDGYTLTYRTYESENSGVSSVKKHVNKTIFVDRSTSDSTSSYESLPQNTSSSRCSEKSLPQNMTSSRCSEKSLPQNTSSSRFSDSTPPLVSTDYSTESDELKTHSLDFDSIPGLNHWASCSTAPSSDESSSLSIYDELFKRNDSLDEGEVPSEVKSLLEKVRYLMETYRSLLKKRRALVEGDLTMSEEEIRHTVRWIRALKRQVSQTSRAIQYSFDISKRLSSRKIDVQDNDHKVYKTQSSSKSYPASAIRTPRESDRVVMARVTFEDEMQRNLVSNYAKNLLVSSHSLGSNGVVNKYSVNCEKEEEVPNAEDKECINSIDKHIHVSVLDAVVQMNGTAFDISPSCVEVSLSGESKINEGEQNEAETSAVEKTMDKTYNYGEQEDGIETNSITLSQKIKTKKKDEEKRHNYESCTPTNPVTTDCPDKYEIIENITAKFMNDSLRRLESSFLDTEVEDIKSLSDTGTPRGESYCESTESTDKQCEKLMSQISYLSSMHERCVAPKSINSILQPNKKTLKQDITKGLKHAALKTLHHNNVESVLKTKTIAPRLARLQRSFVRKISVLFVGISSSN